MNIKKCRTIDVPHKEVEVKANKGIHIGSVSSKNKAKLRESSGIMLVRSNLDIKIGPRSELAIRMCQIIQGNVQPNFMAAYGSFWGTYTLRLIHE